jgi:phage/plasmid primase-like uncharacterized protein
MMQQAIREQIPTKVPPTDGKSSGATCSTSRTNYSKTADNNQLSFSDVHIAAYGQWEYIHTALGVKIVSTDYRKHTACCGCGGKDRFRVMADYGNTGKWFCGGGGDQQSGDGFSLLGHVFGWDSKQQLKAVADYLGLTKMDDSDRAKIRELAEKQSAKIAEITKAKRAEQDRTLELKNLAEDLIDAIKHREYLQKLADRAGSFDIVKDTENEHRIIKALVNIYASKYQKEVSHA